MNLTSSGPSEYRGNCFHQNFEVELDRPVIDVLQVQLHPVLEADVMPAVDLPQASKPRLDAESALLPLFVESLDIPNRQWAQAHVSLQNVNARWQVIEETLVAKRN
jgi:hypothetical protein